MCHNKKKKNDKGGINRSVLPPGISILSKTMATCLMLREAKAVSYCKPLHNDQT